MPTITQNSRLGAHRETGAAMIRNGLDEVHALFPHFFDRDGELAGTAPEGEQAMLEIGRG